jgi:uncharacterized membrane protein YdbT with pleckstrin-like domain
MFDLAFIGGFLGMASDNLPFSPLLLVPFFALHLLPVWIYIFRVVFAFREWRNTDYMVTDKAVYATKGVFTTNCDRKTFQEITNVSVHQGIIDKSHNVGDVFIITGFTTNSKGQSIKQGINIIDVEDYLEVYKLITRTGTDIFSDTMYPNDLRPKENHGYKTKYNPDEE